MPLKGKVLAHNVFIFAAPETNVSQVRFFLDPSAAALEDPRVAGQPLAVETRPPYDFAGTGGDNRARPFDTRRLPNGLHTLVAALDGADGGTEVLIARFMVHHGPAALLFDAGPLSFRLGAGGRSSKMLNLLRSDGWRANATIRSDAAWLRIDEQDHESPASHTVFADAAGLAPGSYTAHISASEPGYAPASLEVSLAVTADCGPLPCSNALVTLPYSLDFGQNHQKILDKNGVGTGFTYVSPLPWRSGYIQANLAMSTAAPGLLKLTTTRGLAYSTSNSQDNALGVGIDAPSQIALLKTTLRNIPATSGNFEQAGLWFGNDQDNYVKFDLISSASGSSLEYVLEENAAITGKKVSGAISVAGAVIELTLRVNPNDRTIGAEYQIAGGTAVSLGQFVAPPEFFSFDAAGIDPTIGTNSFGGIYASHRNGPAALVYSFDGFAVVKEASVTSEPPSDIAFLRSSFYLNDPTAMAWGPDGRLYVTEMYGKIHAISFNSDKQVVADQSITTLGSRLTLGLTVDPASTASNVILWVAHSNASTGNGEVNSSTVSRLSGAGFTSRQDMITGLPRALANHAINSIHFGPDGKLYIALGGNTGAGAPNSANTEFGNRAEQPLSAALLVADVKASGFDGTCALPEGSYGPAPCGVTTYATGLRNSYDFVHHSNGSIYATDNGLGVTGSYPPRPTAPCTGYGSTTSYTQGGNNPGIQPDLLLRVVQNKYYGHPNAYRNECVYKDGSYQNVAAPASYVAPLYNLGMNHSSDGIIEYTSNVFGGALKGELLIANYSVGDDITRIRLSADGRSVVEAKQLIGGFNNPLPLAQGPDGTIYVGEHGGDKVTVLRPNPLGSWSAKQPLPAAILDAGGTAVGGKLYVVAGKTSAGHQSTLSIYTPATNTWATGPALPGPAVENPAATALNGKLYVFGGSTSPFAGAVSNAAAFDPAMATWQALPPLRTARGGATAQAINGKIYVAGGMDGSGASLSSLEIYDPATGTWTAGTAMGTRRDNPGSAVFNSRLYVFGGRTRNADGTTVNGTLASVEMYDPATNSWTARAAMPTGRRTMAVATLNGRAQLMGGEITSSGGAFAQNEEYDPATNSWRTLAAMLTPRHGAVAGTINGLAYVAGGGPSGGSSYTTVNEAFVPPAP
jgi:glucose/arabinose dehydrogenase/N-acetylneuraminic acid mutarotase